MYESIGDELIRSPVMAGLVPAIHAFCRVHEGKAWMAGTRPAMTVRDG